MMDYVDWKRVIIVLLIYRCIQKRTDGGRVWSHFLTGKNEHIWHVNKEILVALQHIGIGVSMVHLVWKSTSSLHDEWNKAF